MNMWKVLLVAAMLAGCASAAPPKTEWQMVNGAWLQTAPVVERPWWEPVSWLWCGAFGSVCPSGPRPMWSTVVNGIAEATQYLDVYNMPTPK